jgi:hypothetical protein
MEVMERQGSGSLRKQIISVAWGLKAAVLNPAIVPTVSSAKVAEAERNANCLVATNIGKDCKHHRTEYSWKGGQIKEDCDY